MRTITAAEAKAGMAELLRSAENGEETVVTRNGVPVAKVVPLRERVGGFMAGEVVEIDEEWWLPEDALADEFGT